MPQIPRVESATERGLRWARAAIDVVAGLPCSVLVRLSVGLLESAWLGVAIVLAIAAAGWFVRRRAWTVAFLAGCAALLALESFT